MNHQEAMARLKKRAEEYKRKSGRRKQVDLDLIEDCRLRAMATSLAEEYPEFIELCPPTRRSEGLYRRVRHVQKTGKCCGFKMSPAQLHELFALAGRKSVKDPVLYLCRIIDRLHVERTIATLKKRLRAENALQNVAARLQARGSWELKYWGDLVLGRYSMDDIMRACEIAEGKDNPPAYFTAVFRNGKPRWLCEPAEVAC